MTRPVMITVAPNGARKLRKDHPALPISPVELGATAASSFDAGASMLHLHVRDKNQQHSLDPDLYCLATQEIKRQAGSELIVQITTESVGKYRPEEQIECVKRTKPEAVSLALREIIPNDQYEATAARFFTWLHIEKIAPQWILYDQEDIQLFKNYCVRGLIPDEIIHVLIVLGRHHKTNQSNPTELEGLVTLLNQNWHWSACAFGKEETKCMERAIELNGHCRVGFENNLYLADGREAPSNTDLVLSTAEAIRSSGNSVASCEAVRNIFGIFPR